jgi:prephenate dehydratase
VQAIVNAGDRARAAIAGSEAAALYGGTILLEHIEDFANNFTRFVLLSPQAGADDDNNSTTTIALTIPNRPGSLYHALAPFAQAEIDLRSLLSRPIKGKPWQYRFFLDVAASKQQLEKLVAGPLRAMDAEIRYLGSCNSSRDLHK